jgi:hypothetical protein
MSCFTLPSQVVHGLNQVIGVGGIIARNHYPHVHLEVARSVVRMAADVFVWSASAWAISGIARLRSSRWQVRAMWPRPSSALARTLKFGWPASSKQTRSAHACSQSGAFMPTTMGTYSSSAGSPRTRTASTSASVQPCEKVPYKPTLEERLRAASTTSARCPEADHCNRQLLAARATVATGRTTATPSDQLLWPLVEEASQRPGVPGLLGQCLPRLVQLALPCSRRAKHLLLH